MNSSTFRKTRLVALDRDGYSCQICGKLIDPKHTRYAVHHLNGNDEPDNLITLCAQCHRKAHKKPHTDKTTISIEEETRDRLADIGKKRETYDTILNEIIDFYLEKR